MNIQPEINESCSAATNEKLRELYEQLLQAKREKKLSMKMANEEIKRIEDEMKELIQNEQKE